MAGGGASAGRGARRTAAGAVLALAPLLVPAGPAAAGEVFAGLYAHDVDLNITVCCYERGADVQFGARTGPLPPLRRWGDFRLYGFGALNTRGGTDFAAAGVAWRLPLGERFYLQPGLGAAIHNGGTLSYQIPGKLELGARVLFEPELAFGARLSPRWSAELSYLHLSHGQLAGRQNPGLDDLGARLVYRFGE
jgi:hypothetical protein